MPWNHRVDREGIFHTERRLPFSSKGMGERSLRTSRFGFVFVSLKKTSEAKRSLEKTSFDRSLAVYQRIQII